MKQLYRETGGNICLKKAELLKAKVIDIKTEQAVHPSLL